jgi:hypothetical protein
MSAHRKSAQRKDLGWVLLEVFAALAAAVAIVWWTIPKRPKDDTRPSKDRDGRGEG